MPIIKDPQPMPPVDFLITESTYGGKIHEPVTNMKDSLCRVIQRTTERDGKVVIPLFSVGRTQEVVFIRFMNYLRKAGCRQFQSISIVHLPSMQVTFSDCIRNVLMKRQ